MLCGLSIRNIVLIDSLDLSFSRGLTVLSGETGAGKSILLDALGVALGGRVDTSMRRDGAPQASVTATFEIKNHEFLEEFFDKSGLSVNGPEEQLLHLRRVINDDGRTRAFINDQPVTANMLREIGDLLVEIQGQFDAQGLLNSKTHLKFLDIFANHTQLLSRVAEAYSLLSNAKLKLKRATEELSINESRKEYLEIAVEELASLKPIEGEEAKLLETRSELMNAEKIIIALNEALQFIGGEGGAITLVAKAQKTLDKTSDRITKELESLERAANELSETESVVGRLATEIELDTSYLEEIDERLNSIRTLARKHGVTPDELNSKYQEFCNQLRMVEDEASQIEALERELESTKAKFIEDADALSKSRITAGKRLDQAIISELKPLKLAQSKFQATIESCDESGWSVYGWDKVTFQISTNPGTPLGPLQKVASGGELSRLLLALRVALSAATPLPTLIFDEVDAGVGGAVAAAVGRRLKRLGEKIQVLVVTHSPQVAAEGHVHWKIVKDDTTGLQRTAAKELAKTERVEEIARMLSGEMITEEARAASLKLLEN
jgi:DNA repair protein RecN (Recombination protein N)|tara:strand:+ start:5041 stop:6702 length:1662 start_codon:yes stop_codon:yes gene_type:complete